MSETRGFRYPTPGGELPADALGAAAAPPAGGRVLDFRRRRGGPTRRKRQSFALKLARPLALAALVVAMPLSLGAWTLTSGRFALADLDVRSDGARVPAAWVRAALAPLVGHNLVRMPLDLAARRLASNRWIASAEIVKDLPHRLRVRIVEKRPAILLKSAGRLFYADAAGAAIAPLGGPAEETQAHRQGLLTVSFVHPVRSPEASVAAALDLAAQVRRDQPEWIEGLSQIDILGEEDFQLHSSALPCPVLVARGPVADKLARLERLLPQLIQRYPAGLSAIDLRFTERIVLQPTVSRQPTDGAKPPGGIS